ncbi:hypothetical protein CL617_00810 [archaeon]|nr:hypothetical protein [archaeon]
MNKKGLGFKTIGAIILILFVLATILAVLNSTSSKLWEPLKEIFGFGYDGPDFATLNEEAISNFDVMMEDINTCLSSEKAECGCSISFNGLAEHHAIKTDNSKIFMLNIKGGNEITMDSAEINNLNCYIDNDFKSNELKSNERIKFNEKTPYIDISLWFDLDFKYKYNVYKKGDQLCWLTNKVNNNNFDLINKC